MRGLLLEIRCLFFIRFPTDVIENNNVTFSGSWIGYELQQTVHGIGVPLAYLEIASYSILDFRESSHLLLQTPNNIKRT